MMRDIDCLMTTAERAKFAKELANLAKELVPTDTVKEVSAKMSEINRHPTEHEERMWLLQQQEPDAVCVRSAIYRLSGSLNVSKLVSSIYETILAMPDLNARYYFDEEGGLRRQISARESECVAIRAVGSRHELIEAVLARQGETWDPERVPPFRAELFLTGSDAYIALFLNRILDEAYTPEFLVRALMAAYEGRRPETAQRCYSPFSFDENRAAPIGWIRRTEKNLSIEHADLGSSAVKAPSGRNTTTCCRAIVHAEVLGSSPFADLLIATISERFARFVCRLGGHAKIGLVLRHWKGDPDGSSSAALDRHRFDAGKPIDNTNSQRRAASDWVHDTVIAFDSGCSAKEALDLILARLEGAMPGSPLPPDPSVPEIHVRRLDDPATSRGEITFEHLLIPTLELRPDLELATGFDADGNVVLELSTGQAISRYACAFLLERFVAFLGGEREIEEWAPPLITAHVAKEQGTSPIVRPVEAVAVETESVTALILAEFREALAFATMGPDDDFFDHGGHSLTATRIIGRLLSKHGIEIHFNELFSHPTAASLARYARLSDAAVSHWKDKRDEKPLTAPLSLAQASLWKAWKAFDFGEVFNIPFALDFIDPVDERVFERAFQDILERHSGLRTLFTPEDCDVIQREVPPEELHRYKWFWTSPDSAGISRHSEACYRFDLARELPIRLRFLIDPVTGRQTLSFLFHHIVLDEWSVNLMMDELVHAYRARATGEVPVWTTAPIPFAKFAGRQMTTGVNGIHLDYWTERLRTAPRELKLFDVAAPVPHLSSDASPAGGWVEFRLERHVSDGLYGLAKESGASLFNVVYAAIVTSLHKIGGLTDIVIGTSASGRTDSSFFDTIGYFTTVVAHRLQFQAATSVGELVDTVKQTINGSMPYTDIPIDLVEEALGMEPGRDHLFEVFIQIHAKNKLNGAINGPGGSQIRFRQIDPDKHESLLGLQFEVMEEEIDKERSIRVLMSYRSDHYTPQQVERLRKTTSDVFASFSKPGVSIRPISNLS